MPCKNIMLLDLAAIANSITFLKSRCFYPATVPHSVERLGVNLEKINKQVNLALETTKPFPLIDPLFLQTVFVQRKTDFHLILDEHQGLKQRIITKLHI